MNTPDIPWPEWLLPGLGSAPGPAARALRRLLCLFFLEGLEASAEQAPVIHPERLPRATLVCGVFDDAASGQGLLNYFLRAINCGAIAEEELKSTGLTLAEIQTRSFLQILEGRRSRLI
jgi:hypothetical protein